MLKKKRRIVIILIIYLIISSLYIAVRIDFKEAIFYENLAYEKVSIISNVIRFIMGLPIASNGCIGVSPKYLIEIILKVIVAIILTSYLIIHKKIYENEIAKSEDKSTIKRKKCNVVYFIIIAITFMIFLLDLYMTYLTIHCIR